MAERVLGPTGSRRRRRFLLVPILVVSAVAMMFVAGAQAVHGEAFQLDGDVLASTTTNIGGVTQTVDWDSLFDANGLEKPLPAGFNATSFDKDFNNTGTTFLTDDTSTFATGSKDELAIADWQCNFDNNVNSKIDVMNAYAATYTDPVSGDDFIYFGLERNANTGTADVGFWFLKNPVGCESTGGAVDFQGAHADGDLLVVSEFTGGGTVSTIKVFRWDGDDATGGLNPTPVAEGVDCRDPLLPATDGACGASNRVPITTPWLTAAKTLTPKVGHSLPIAQFFEGGVNLTAADIEGCFTTYIADTRSSAETTATLFDYSSKTLGGCTTDVVTTPLSGGNPIPAGGLDIPGDPANAAISVTDRAVVTVEGVDTFTATLTFHLCGPFAAGSTTLCDTGGVLVDTQNLTADGTFTSAAATVTSAGRYCWRADFSGDEAADVPSGSDSRASECFTVNPRTPVLTTQAGAGPVTLGQPVTDTATLTNTAHKKGTGGPAGSTDGSINPATLGGDATGTITFTLYKDNACTVLATGTGTNPQTVSVSGNGTYGPVSYVPDAPGTYHWVASYGGDLPNTTASSPSACLDENEDVVVVGQSALSTAQDWLPNDTATVTGPTNLNGTLTFTLYTGSDCATSGTPVPNQSYSFTLTNAASPAVRSTTNSTFKVTAANEGAYSWLVHYDDTTLTDPPDRCETTTVSITD